MNSPISGLFLMPEARFKNVLNFSDQEIKDFLDIKFDQYNRPEFIVDDPISIPHRFSQKEDIEIAAFLTATISWGKRSSIIQSANWLMHLMNNSPWEFIKSSSQNEIKQCNNFYHRTFNGSDCIFFLKSVKNIYKNHNGLERIFSEPIIMGKTLKESIIKFRKIFLGLPHPNRLEKHIADPYQNASAKRINMFLRWMIRKDNCGVDFGIWNSISPSMLFCPLDVHTGNVSRKLGLLSRNSNDWKSVEELTSRLQHFDSNDPVKYDLALFGLGIHENFNSFEKYLNFSDRKKLFLY
jgi:uncharacterized protein (TIGR02757 family)